MSAAKEKSTEVAVTAASKFAVVNSDPKQLQDTIKENIGGELNVFDLEKLKIPAGGGTHWTIGTLEGDKMEKEVDGILIFFQDTRGYWETSYDENPGQPPTCSAQGTLVGTGTPGGDCTKCPLAEFGSADKGEGQACSQGRRMFLLTEGALLPTMVTCPPTSLKNVRRYFMKLASHNVPYYTVLTRLKLSKDKNSSGVEYSKVEFETIGQLTPAEVERVQSYRQNINPALGDIPIDGDYREDVSERS